MKNLLGRGTVISMLLTAFTLILPDFLSFAAPLDLKEQPTMEQKNLLPVPDIKAQRIVAQLNAAFVSGTDEIAYYFYTIKGEFLVTGCIKKPFFGKITINGNTLIEKEVTNVDPDCSRYTQWDSGFEGSWKNPTPGTHTLIFTVDSKNDIYESNELNNSKSITVNIPLPAIDKIKDIKTKPPIPVPIPNPR